MTLICGSNVSRRKFEIRSGINLSSVSHCTWRENGSSEYSDTSSLRWSGRRRPSSVYQFYRTHDEYVERKYSAGTHAVQREIIEKTSRSTFRYKCPSWILSCHSIISVSLSQAHWVVSCLSSSWKNFSSTWTLFFNLHGRWPSLQVFLPLQFDSDDWSISAVIDVHQEYG